MSNLPINIKRIGDAPDLSQIDDKDVQVAFLAAIQSVCERFGVGCKANTGSVIEPFSEPDIENPEAKRMKDWRGVWVFVGRPVEMDQ